MVVNKKEILMENLAQCLVNPKTEDPSMVACE